MTRHKTCTRCGKSLPATTDFFPKRTDSKDGLRNQCTACIKAERKQRYAENREAAIRYSAEWSRNNPERMKKYRRTWYENHRDEVAEKNRAWWAANPGKSAEYSRRWRALNPEKARAKTRRWYRKNSGQALAINRRWMSENRERRRQQQKIYRENHKAERALAFKRWAQANPEKQRVTNRRRRARLIEATGDHTEKDIQQQYESQKGKCWWCGCDIGNEFHVDHLVPLSRGGSNAPENLVISCPTCNLSKGNKMPHEWIGRLF